MFVHYLTPNGLPDGAQQGKTDICIVRIFFVLVHSLDEPVRLLTVALRLTIVLIHQVNESGNDLLIEPEQHVTDITFGDETVEHGIAVIDWG